MKDDDGDIMATFFGEGADARIAGLRFEDCPVSENYLKELWQEGWLNVHLHWGKGWPSFPHPRLHPTKRIPDMPDPATDGLARRVKERSI